MVPGDLPHRGLEQHGVVGGAHRFAVCEVDLDLPRSVFGVGGFDWYVEVQQGGPHVGQAALQFEVVDERRVLDVGLHRCPVLVADVALQLGGRDRFVAQSHDPVDLRLEQVPWIQWVGLVPVVDGVRHHRGVAGPVPQESERRQVRLEVHVQETGAHVDERAVHDVALHVHHVDGVGYVCAVLRHGVDEPLCRDPLAARVSVGVDDQQLHGVDVVVGD